MVKMKLFLIVSALTCLFASHIEGTLGKRENLQDTREGFRNETAAEGNGRSELRRPEYTLCEEPYPERIIVDRHFSGTDLDPEHKLWYFREDYGVNSFHLHWHYAYYINFGSLSDRKDRSGELFYYAHNQILARYNTERLANGLKRVKRLSSYRERIPEAYFPKLTRKNSALMWGSRPQNLYFTDITKEIILGDYGPVQINELERWRNNIMDAVNEGFIVYPNGSRKSLMDVDGTPEGIDLLGRMVEASYSPNPGLYGNLHNRLHFAVSMLHDPEGKYNEDPGVMSWFGVAMRDPAFYRLHKDMDFILNEHKLKLPPYSKNELSFEGVRVESIKVQTPGFEDNLLLTGWQRTDVDLGMGLDMYEKHQVPVRITHLQHKIFEYQINIFNNNSASVTGTVRVFLAPKLDENNDEFTLDVQRTLMIEMDKFQAELQPGDNLVNKSSLESEVTLSLNNTFMELNETPGKGSPKSYCGCGWPNHMLVPRGMRHGMLFQLVVMVTNAAVDRVSQPATHSPLQCGSAPSYCGLYGGRYPDRRPLGFPWDRRIEPEHFPNISSFPENTGNVDITIQFTDTFL